MDQDSGKIYDYVYIHFVRILEEKSSICHSLQSSGPEAARGKLFPPKEIQIPPEGR